MACPVFGVDIPRVWASFAACSSLVFSQSFGTQLLRRTLPCVFQCSSLPSLLPPLSLPERYHSQRAFPCGGPPRAFYLCSLCVLSWLAQILFLSSVCSITFIARAIIAVREWDVSPPFPPSSTPSSPRPNCLLTTPSRATFFPGGQRHPVVLISITHRPSVVRLFPFGLF